MSSSDGSTGSSVAVAFIADAFRLDAMVAFDQNACLEEGQGITSHQHHQAAGVPRC